MSAYANLQEHIAEINDLLNAISILKWDVRTQMPPGGAETRGYQLATLSRIVQEKFTSDKTARLLDAAEAEVANEDSDSLVFRAVSQTRMYYEIVKRIPVALGRQKSGTLACITTDLGKSKNQQ